MMDQLFLFRTFYCTITLFTFAFSSTESDNVTFDIVQSIATDDIDCLRIMIH